MQNPNSSMEPVQVEPISNGAKYQINSSSSDPWFLGVAPDIDVHTTISITHPLPRIINIEVTMIGDLFPAHEAVLRDRTGNGLFLGGFMPTTKREGVALIGDTKHAISKLNLQMTVDAQYNFDRILSAKFSGPYSAIGKTLTNQTFSLAGWNRAFMTALTPDHMPPPQLPPPSPTPTLKQQLAPQKSKQVVPINLQQGPEKSKQSGREKSKHGTDKSKQVSSETRGASKEKSPQEKSMEKPVVIKNGPGIGM